MLVRLRHRHSDDPDELASRRGFAAAEDATAAPTD
jgi:hypothetical protein